MEKEIVYEGKSPDFGISQSSGLTTENSVNNQPGILPENGIIFESKMIKNSDRSSENPHLVSDEPFKKTRLMKRIEGMEKFGGKGIQDILLDLYWGEEVRGLSEVGQEIGLKDKSGVAKLIRGCNIHVRTVSEAGVLVWQDPAKRARIQEAFRTVRYQPFKETWENKNDELRKEAFGETRQEQRKNLKRLLRAEGSVHKAARKLKENGIGVGRPLIQRWIDDLDVPFFTKVAAGMLVREAERNGWLSQLSPRERLVLEKHRPKNPRKSKVRPLKKIAKDLGVGTKERARQIEEGALVKLRKIKKGKPLSHSGGQRKEVDEDKMIERFREKMSMAKIGEEQGVSRMVVSDRLIARGEYKKRGRKSLV